MWRRLLAGAIGHRRREYAVLVGVLALGSGVSATLLGMLAGLGDVLAEEFRKYGANLVAVPEAAALRAEVHGIPVPLPPDRAFLLEEDLAELDRMFWRNNIVAAAPVLPAEARWNGRLVRVIGTYCKELQKVHPTWKVEGRLPDGMEVWAGERLGVGVGDEIELGIGGRTEHFDVAGVLRGAAGYRDAFIAPLKVVQQLTGHEGRYRELLVRAVTTPEMELIRKGLDPAELSPADYERWSCTPYPSTIAHQIEKCLRGARVSPVRRVTRAEASIRRRVHGATVFLAVLCGAAAALAVLGLMSAIVMDRRREFAVLRASGAQTSSVALLVLGEALFAGVVGGAAGCLLALGPGRWVMAGFFAPAAAAGTAVLLSAWLVAVIVVLAGALLPLRLAVRVSPATWLHGY